LSAFETRFPNSPLQLDSAKKRTQVLKARDRDLTETVRKRWNYWLRRLARQAGRLETYEEVLTYVQETLPEEIRARVLDDVRSTLASDIEPDQILEYWSNRKKVRYENASYGLGTWLLGEDKARAGIEEKQESESESEISAARKSMAEKQKRFLEQQRLAARARNRQDQADDFDAFWRSFPLGARAQWVRAYYVEFSGDMELRPNPYIRPCPTCAGSGALEVIYSGGGGQGTASGTKLEKCTTCRGIGVVRRVYYR